MSPGVRHEGPLTLLRQRPDLLGLVLERAGVPVGPNAAELPTAFATEATAEAHPQRAADLVLGPMVGPGQDEVLVVVEVQLQADPDKRWTWPTYLVNLRDRHHRPVVLVVLAPDRRVAKWAEQKIETGHPGFVLRPIVMGPSQVPLIVDPDDAVQAPELGVLSAVFHGRGSQAKRLGRAVLEGLTKVDESIRGAYVDLLLASLTGPARREVEDLMVHKAQYESEFMRRFSDQAEIKTRTALCLGLREVLMGRFPEMAWDYEVELASALPSEHFQEAFRAVMAAESGVECRKTLRRVLADA
jgi:hypothetical protein